jgi:3-methyladenine DNA glycosylase/8-oxoguanine DNA glycosylase
MEFQLKTSSKLDLEKTVLSHGWINLAPWHWDYNKAVLTRLEKFPSGKIGYINVSQKNSTDFQIKIFQTAPSLSDREYARKSVMRWLSIDWNPEEAVSVANKNSPKVAKFIEHGGGRFLRGSNFYEDFVKTLCTVNASWEFTKLMVYRLVNSLGSGVFPSPSRIIYIGRRPLEEVSRMGYRAAILVNLTNKLLERKMIDKEGEEQIQKINYESLISLQGIGPYAASHLMFLLHDYSRIPVDKEVSKYCRDALGIEKRMIPSFFSKWENYSLLGYKIERIISKTNWIG